MELVTTKDGMKGHAVNMKEQELDDLTVCEKTNCGKFTEDSICTCKAFYPEGQAFRIRRDYCPIGSAIAEEEERKAQVGAAKNRRKKKMKRTRGK